MSVDAEPLHSGAAGLRLAGARAESTRGFGRGRVWALLLVDVVAVWLALAGTYLRAEQIGTEPAVVAPARVRVALVSP